MKAVTTYVCLVDHYRIPDRQRNTRGRYLVGAKSKREARKLLQKAIGFGSVFVYYDLNSRDKCHWAPSDKRVEYKELVKVGIHGYEHVRHANMPLGGDGS